MLVLWLCGGPIWCPRANPKKIHEGDIPRIEGWAIRNGSSFAAEKTELIHLTRRKRELGHGHIVIDGETIHALPTAKLLGVIFDQERRWKHHVQQAVKRATKTTIGMGGLRHLRPAQMRQIYQACVIPKLDYASTVWYNPFQGREHLRALNTVQRTALIRILSAFRTVATPTLEVECHVTPTRLRLKRRAQEVIMRLCSLPNDHPIFKVIERTKRRTRRRWNYPKFFLAEAMKTMELDQNIDSRQWQDRSKGKLLYVTERRRNLFTDHELESISLKIAGF